MKTTNANEARVDFALSVLLIWIKGYISVDNRTIKTSTSNVILGLIPAGRDEQIFRLDNVQGSSTSASYKLGRFIWGAILAIIGFSTLGSSFFAGLIILLVGVVLFLGGILTSITIQGNGSNYKISVPFFEKGKIQQINNAIQEALIYGQDAHDNNRVMANANQNTAAVVNAIQGQNAAQAQVQSARKFCTSCGAAIDGNSKFCSKCGAQN